MTKYSNFYFVERANAAAIIRLASTKDLRTVRATFTQIANGLVLKPNFGICRNADALLSDTPIVGLAYHAVEYFSYGWQHHSGIINYPVPARADVYCGLWQGEQLVLRQHLLAYLVKQITLYIERNGDAS